MIKSVSIRNFQSHKTTDLEFSNGVNVIVGSSDSGKTAIIRALRWLVWNRPQGEAFRSDWGGKTEVSVALHAPEIEIDPEVTRIKDKQDEYIMNGSSFKAFRTDIPQEIQNVLNISDINLQQQLDSPFLLSQTPGEVASHFNKVAKLDKIDTGLQNVQKAIREIEQIIKYKTQEKETQEEALQGYSYLEKMEADVEVLEDMESVLNQKETAKNRIEKQILDYKDTAKEIEKYSDLLKLEEKVNQILQDIALSTEKDRQLVKLENLLEQAKEDTADIKNNTWLLSFELPVNTILTDMKKKDELELELGDLESDTSDIIEVKGKLETAIKEESVLQERFIKEMGTVCILCGSKLK